MDKKKILCSINNFLDTDHLDEIGKNNHILKKYYLGTFPADNFPNLNHQKCCWICNTDMSNEDGQHWVAFIKNNDTITFFDSYGKSPTYYNRTFWVNYLKRKKLNFKLFSKRKYQSSWTKCCGAWCIAFLIDTISGKKTPLDFVETNTSKLRNDMRLMKYVGKKTNLEYIYQKICKTNRKNQKCCSFNKLKIN